MSAPSGPEPPAYHPVAYPMAPVATPRGLACPREVKLAIWLTVAGSLLFVATIALILSASIEDVRDTVRDSRVDDGVAFTEHDVRSGARGTVFVLMVLTVLSTAPYVTFGALLRTGRNWTRVVLTVFLSIGCFFTFIQALLPYPHTSLLFRLLNLAIAGVAVTIIVLLFGRSANRYYACATQR